VADEVQWATGELKAFASALNHDKDGRALKKQMESQFNSITETLRDRLRHGIGTISGAGSYPSVLAEAVEFKTKLVGGKNARVSVIGEGRTAEGKWREVGKLLDNGILYHPAWGYWRGNPPPSYLRQDVPNAPQMVDDVLDRSEPVIAEEIRTVLTDYLDRLTNIRKA
jgi:hypothetical protein